MKRFAILIAAAAAVLCGCSKLNDRIDQIEDRVSALETACADLNTTISTVQKLVEAQAAGISIKDVQKVENGFKITFSDGTSYAIVNGEKGDKPAVTAVAKDGVYYWQVNGEWLVDADRNMIPVTGAAPQLKIEEDNWYVSVDGGKTWDILGVAGKGVEVEVTEDDEAYYFDFGNDNVVTIAKMAVFVLKVEKDSISVAANATETVSYTITGADETTHIVAEASGYTASVDAKANTISVKAGAETAEGYVIVKAIRNSDGAATSQFITVNAAGSGSEEGGDDPKDAFTITISDIKADAATVTFTPADNEMTYIYMLTDKDYLDEYGLDTDDALFADDMDYFEYLADKYGLTLQQVLDVYLTKGEKVNTYDELDPETEYVAYAYGLTTDNKLATKIIRANFTTLKSEGGSDNEPYAAYLGTWDVKGQKISSNTPSDYEGTITIKADQEGTSYTISGVGTYPMKAVFNATTKNLEVPFGAGNIIGKFNFGATYGTQYGCWMGYDGTYVYKGGNFYFAISADGNKLESKTIDADTQEIIDPIGFSMGVFALNEDGSIGDWMKLTFNDKFLFSSITRASSTSSVKSRSRSVNVMDLLTCIPQTPEKCMLEVR